MRTLPLGQDSGWAGNLLDALDLIEPEAAPRQIVYLQEDYFLQSPVPQVLMLGGDRVPGNLPAEIKEIPVRQKADALFFLHTSRVDRRLNDHERREGKQLAMFRYVVRYADGGETVVPVISETHIDDYRQQKPQALPGAQLAWTRLYPNSDISAAAYAMQWNNPRPDVEITSIDMVYGPERCGVPRLIAVTAAIAR